MAAMLEPHAKTGKVPPSNIPAREAIGCLATCDFVYTLSYTDDEAYMLGSENNLDIMRRKARELISNDHPAHDRVRVWSGPKKGWLDREEARAAGL